MILAVPSINVALREEFDDLGLTLPRSETGSFLVTGALLALVIIGLRVVIFALGDDVQAKVNARRATGS